MQWTADRVQYELVSAFEVLYDIEGAPRPSGFGCAWPEYMVEATDLWEQRRSGTNYVGRLRARIPRKAPEVSAMNVVLLGSRLPSGEQATGWMREFLRPASWEFRCLQRSSVDRAMCALRDIRYRSAKSAEAVRCHRQTFAKYVASGAEIIAMRLNEEVVKVW